MAWMPLRLLQVFAVPFPVTDQLLIMSSTSMALQTPNVIRWTRHMDECLQVLEQSPASLPSDKVLCHHCRLQHIVEEFELQLSTSVTGLEAVKSAHLTFEEQLTTWASIPRLWTGMSALFYLCLALADPW